MAEGIEVGEDVAVEGTEVDTVVATVDILHIEQEGKRHGLGSSSQEVCMFKGTKV